ncbi:hypothetical protein [Myxacorys almedinensis]|uniref:Uncharacterized protein n=1 Tax=Myxacorys almedinensis A TaxID=2690445 RepID=A0A8J7Z5A4_9CYAN|nr:hypothetical protein [Myxacorys almedinensis]NDJ19630.1 hypothetical protein [Myxacorys almedinensis A]
MLKFQRSTLFFWCVILGMAGFNGLSELNVNTVLSTELLLIIAAGGVVSTWVEVCRRSKPSD